MKTLIQLTILLFGLSLHAQKHSFGKVSVEELKKEKSTIDAESEAEVLYEKIDIILEFNPNEKKLMVTKEVEGRIKIFNKDNVDEDYLKHEVSYYSPTSSAEKISGFKGVTYNLVDGKVEETKVRNSDILTEKKNKYWSVDKFAYPNVKDGSVLEYKYTIVSPHYREIERWYFQQEIPVLYSELNFSHPDFFQYSLDERGEITGKRTNSMKPVINMDYLNIEKSYVFENVKPLKKEPFVLNTRNLLASVRFELLRFEYPGFLSENYSATWEQISKDLFENKDLGGQLNGNSFLDETVQSLIQGKTKPEEKMQIIFDHVKSNYAWNNFTGLFADKGVRQTFKDKTGNAADINLLLISMLKKAGLEAHPVVLSTVNNLTVHYTFPSLTSLNFVVASVQLNNGYYLMDATEKASKINMLPLRDLNHRGFLISGKGKIIEVPLINNSVSSIKEIITAEISPNGEISGSYNETKSEYFAMMDNINRAEDSKEYEKDFLSNFTFDVQDFKVDENITKDMIRLSFNFEGVPGAEILGNKILFNPLFFTQLTKASFKQESRNYPLEFGTISSRSKIIKIKIPEGYKIESLPEEKNFLVENNVAGYAYKLVEKDGYLILSTLSQIGQSLLPSAYYKPMKECEKQQISAENQQVVLVKI